MVRLWFARALIADATSNAAMESSPEVGSSRKIVDGKETSSTAMARRLASPPL
eukprot:CAMPEP_0171879106 /NCGR_PEP_ID=MMETSP0992-20121227/37683_1 /TAXON_ID=483369 /ORGANISM="non described non described, Strain CCMP2098" /LENGTH=52 /DNA_ID=CAMNT_0012504661 /DNA_START=182 /DNA_END=336 /DNA_ORIENTATION=-